MEKLTFEKWRQFHSSGFSKLSGFELTQKKYILKLLIKKEEEVFFKTAKENF